MKRTHKRTQKVEKKRQVVDFVRISKREYAALQADITFWRRKFEDTFARMNELTNTLLMTNGLPSPTPRDEHDSGADHHPPAIKKLEMLIPELLAETIEDTLETEPAEAEV